MQNINISIDDNTLHGVIFIFLLLFVAYIYTVSRKYNSIDKYMKLVADKSKTYEQNLEEYNNCFVDLGIKRRKLIKFFLKIKQLIRGSG